MIEVARAAPDRLSALAPVFGRAFVDEPIYERSGFRVVEDLDAPVGGPHIWFMRWDP